MTQHQHTATTCSSMDKRTLPTQVHTRLLWVVGITLLGTVDVVTNLCNNIYFSQRDLRRCVVVGAPPLALWVVQSVFTALATVFYVLETVNTLSIFRRHVQETLVPIHLELLVTLALEHIPLAAINYFTMRCRMMYANPLQTMLGAIRILFVFVRMVWYAHIEGKKLKHNDKYRLQRGFFMLVCVFFACSMVFPITIWREARGLKLDDAHLRDVSVYLLKLPPAMTGRHVLGESVETVLDAHHANPVPWLVPSLVAIRHAGAYGYNATYHCHNVTALLPSDCLPPYPHDTPPAALAFKFIYTTDAPVCHLGEIRYNYAQIYDNEPCVPSQSDISGGWKLSYYNRTVAEKPHQGVSHFNLSSPWPYTCVTPVPWYDPHISVCDP